MLHTVDEMLGGHIAAQSIVCDFEVSMHSAIRNVWPQMCINGCYFHFTQTLVRRLSALGLKRAYMVDDDLQSIVKKLAALAFLPPEVVAIQFR